MTIAAFFDLDRTLLTVNSGRLWVEAERRSGRISREQLGWAMLYLAAYKLGVVDMERAMEQAVRTLKGMAEGTLRSRTHAWYDAHVRRHAAPGAFRAIAHHRERAHRLVLLTSSSAYEAERAIEHFGLDAALCTRFEVRDGLFTGAVERPLCYGEGKVALAEAHAKEHGVDLDESYFYTDSITDRPMLERVGHPRAVHPDPRLRLLALRRGWPTLDWRRTNRDTLRDNRRTEPRLDFRRSGPK
jgi:HAD superfamily hydrolase (TIGR01490 family)